MKIQIPFLECWLTKRQKFKGVLDKPTTIEYIKYTATFDVELAFFEASDWTTQNQLIKTVTGVGKIHAYYDEMVIESLYKTNEVVDSVRLPHYYFK